MPVEISRPRSAPKTIPTSAATSVGRFYEKRHQLHGALDQYSKALSSKPDDTATYIDRSRVFLKMGSITRAQEDTDSALNLLEDTSKNANLLVYYACLQKAEVLYVDGEFELALMYFHRANKIKPAQQTCLEGIRKATEILECTVCNPNVHLTVSSTLMNLQKQQRKTINLLKRPPIRKQLRSIEIPLTEYQDKDANRLLAEVAKDRQLLIQLYTNKQAVAGFTGLDKAKIEARQAISIVESQLKFLDRAECLSTNESALPKPMICSSKMDRTTLTRIAEDELGYLQKLLPKEKSTEILYRSMKIINCLHLDHSLDPSTRLLLAEAFRLVGQSYNEMQLFDQSFDHYQQAYQVLLPLQDSNCLYRATFDIARSLLLAKKYPQSIETFLDMLTQATSDSERAFVYQYISLCYLNLKNYDQAKKAAYQILDYASLANEELLRIEGNILLGRISLKVKDYQRAEEYFIFARNLKDQIGDVNHMKYLDEILDQIRNQKERLLQEKLTRFDQKEDNDDLHRLNEQWISSIIPDNQNEDIPRDEVDAKKISNWRILIPYHRLFDICIERKKKSRPSKLPPTTNTTPSTSLPLVSTNK